MSSTGIPKTFKSLSKRQWRGCPAWTASGGEGQPISLQRVSVSWRLSKMWLERVSCLLADSADLLGRLVPADAVHLDLHGQAGAC